jgi:hypothetical protein
MEEIIVYANKNKLVPGGFKLFSKHLWKPSMRTCVIMQEGVSKLVKNMTMEPLTLQESTTSIFPKWPAHATHALVESQEFFSTDVCDMAHDFMKNRAYAERLDYRRRRRAILLFRE